MKIQLFLFLFSFLSIACDSNDKNTIEDEFPNEDNIARVLKVTPLGTKSPYTFDVEIESPDTGCDQYANWWEVVTADGELLYRRILAHSHVEEQPFTRSGGPIDISSNQMVIVRVHMNTTGYSKYAIQGSINEGFSGFTITKDFAGNLETIPPQPKECAF